MIFPAKTISINQEITGENSVILDDSTTTKTILAVKISGENASTTSVLCGSTKIFSNDYQSITQQIFSTEKCDEALILNKTGSDNSLIQISYYKGDIALLPIDENLFQSSTIQYADENIPLFFSNTWTGSQVLLCLMSFLFFVFVILYGIIKSILRFKVGIYRKDRP